MSTPNTIPSLTARVAGLYTQIQIFQVQTFILNQVLFGCHATTDFTARFECTLQTSQANKLCRKQNRIILVMSGTLAFHGDHDFQESVCPKPLQDGLCTFR